MEMFSFFKRQDELLFGEEDGAELREVILASAVGGGMALYYSSFVRFGVLHQ
jgi:hypothetical protein